MSRDADDTPPAHLATEREQQLWRLAKERVEFRQHVLVYLVVNTFLWAVWAFGGAFTGLEGKLNSGLPWPAWASLGWGIGLAIHGFTTYGGGADAVQREYEKLRRQRGE